MQKGKDWLESQNNIVNESLSEKERWIEELQKGKDWLESQNNIVNESLSEKEQYIQELIKTKEYLLSKEIKYNEIKKTLFYKIGRKLGFFSNKN